VLRACHNGIGTDPSGVNGRLERLNLNSRELSDLGHTEGACYSQTNRPQVLDRTAEAQKEIAFLNTLVERLRSDAAAAASAAAERAAAARADFAERLEHAKKLTTAARKEAAEVQAAAAAQLADAEKRVHQADARAHAVRFQAISCFCSPFQFVTDTALCPRQVHHDVCDHRVGRGSR
jgi:hypothetical protein